MVDTITAEGTLRNLGGKAQDAVGGLTGDTATQTRGKINEAAGKAQEMYGEAADGVRGFAADQPLLAMLAAAGIGVVVGVLIGRR